MLTNRFGDTLTDYFELKGKDVKVLFICSFCGRALHRVLASVDDQGVRHDWFCSCASALEQVKTNNEIAALQKNIDELKQKILRKKDDFYKRNLNYIDKNINDDTVVKLQIMNDV